MTLSAQQKADLVEFLNASAGFSAQSASAVSLKQDMRKLWTDHVVWTPDNPNEGD